MRASRQSIGSDVYVLVLAVSLSACAIAGAFPRIASAQDRSEKKAREVLAMRSLPPRTEQSIRLCAYEGALTLETTVDGVTGEHRSRVVVPTEVRDAFSRFPAETSGLLYELIVGGAPGVAIKASCWDVELTGDSPTASRIATLSPAAFDLPRRRGGQSPRHDLASWRRLWVSRCGSVRANAVVDESGLLDATQEYRLRIMVYAGKTTVGSRFYPEKKIRLREVALPEDLRTLYSRCPRDVLAVLYEIVRGGAPNESIRALTWSSCLKIAPPSGVSLAALDTETWDQCEGVSTDEVLAATVSRRSFYSDALLRGLTK
ncbi:MAG: hypothetical protein HY719_12170 [Planctomycetes bacterium]|nr:hypothetical protein [Planctomycetota bacterium]